MLCLFSYVHSYWETFDTIAKEGKYLAAIEAFPIHSAIELVNMIIQKNIPQLLVIDTDKKACVGWCDELTKEDTVGYVGIGLLKEYRERGIGSKLLGQIIELSRRYFYRRLELDVRSSNTRAIHVYEKFGFAIYNVVTDGFALGESIVPEDVTQMQLLL